MFYCLVLSMLQLKFFLELSSIQNMQNYECSLPYIFTGQLNLKFCLLFLSIFACVRIAFNIFSFLPSARILSFLKNFNLLRSQSFSDAFYYAFSKFEVLFLVQAGNYGKVFLADYCGTGNLRNIIVVDISLAGGLMTG